MSGLTASSPESISGPLRLLVWPSAPLTEETSRLLERRVDAFASAIRRGLFGSAGLEGMAPLPPPAMLLRGGEPPSWGRLLSVRALPLGALRVLKGMLAFFSEQSAPLLHWELERPGDIRNLLGVSADYPRASREGLLLAIEDGGHLDSSGLNARELAIRIEFREPPPAALREKLMRPFEDWDELVNGGYPPEGAKPGQSAVGPSSTRFIDPYTLEHHVEGILAHPACFEPLFELARHWGQIGFPVAKFELE
jgi:hypothetical protein